jgi:hypothetical protein
MSTLENSASSCDEPFLLPPQVELSAACATARFLALASASVRRLFFSSLVSGLSLSSSFFFFFFFFFSSPSASPASVFFFFFLTTFFFFFFVVSSAPGAGVLGFDGVPPAAAWLTVSGSPLSPASAGRISSVDVDDESSALDAACSVKPLSHEPRLPGFAGAPAGLLTSLLHSASRSAAVSFFGAGLATTGVAVELLVPPSAEAAAAAAGAGDATAEAASGVDGAVAATICVGIESRFTAISGWASSMSFFSWRSLMASSNCSVETAASMSVKSLLYWR